MNPIRRHKYILEAIMTCTMVVCMILNEPITSNASENAETRTVVMESVMSISETISVASMAETANAHDKSTIEEAASILSSASENMVPYDVFNQAEQEETDEDENTYTDRTVYHLYNHGTNEGPSGRETYYNLPMRGVVKSMRNRGYDEEEYPYWVREDGVKMLGDYAIVAANLETRPKGTVLETSVGMAMVCDTGSFVEKHPDGVDIAVDW